MYILKTDTGLYIHRWTMISNNRPIYYTSDINEAFLEVELQNIKSRRTFLNNKVKKGWKGNKHIAGTEDDWEYFPSEPVKIYNAGIIELEEVKL